MEALAAEVEETLAPGRPRGDHRGQVGLAVLERLRALDEVAYVRFASVYKGFSDAGDFEREVGDADQGRPAPKPGVRDRRRSRHAAPSVWR